MKTKQENRFDSSEFAKKFHTDVPLGSFPSDQETRFALWAPTAKSVILQLYRSGNEPEVAKPYAMERGEKGVWSLCLPGNLSGVYYTYAVTVRGVTTITQDPYAKAAGLNGRRSMVIDLNTTNPKGWAEEKAPSKPSENIIYEVHVKDFSYDPNSGVEDALRGKYLGLCASGTTLNGDGIHSTCMDYLKKLGVTHLELLPVYDFGSVDEGGSDAQFNWGYDPINYNVPEGSYSTNPYDGAVRIRELKQMIQTLHANGFRVIMDVVYNHTYSVDSCLENTFPGYFYRKYDNGELSNGSGCGNDIASQRSMCARYIMDSVLYWAEEYHFDGFRFDLMGLIPVELMNQLRNALDDRFGKGEKLVFGEPWRAADTAVPENVNLADKANLKNLLNGVGAFCDATRDAIKGNVFESCARGFVNGGAFSAQELANCIRGWAKVSGEYSVNTPEQTICYLSSHDDWTLWDRLVNSVRKDKDYQTRDNAILKINRLAASILFCCQGNLFFLSGEEFGRTKYGIQNTYCAPLSVNQIDWKRAWENSDLVSYYRGLIALRKQLPAFQDKSHHAAERICTIGEPIENTAVVEMTNEGTWEHLLLFVNVGNQDHTLPLPEGNWQLLFDGEDSFRWLNPEFLSENVFLPRKSAILLGKQ